MDISYRIFPDFIRPPKELVESFRGMAVPNIDDCMGRLAAVDSGLRPMNSAPLLGVAFTIRAPAGDNLMLHKAMDYVKPGDVIMIDAEGYTDRAIFGELISTYFQHKGIAGIVVDGAIRDSATIASMDFPVYARGISPNGPYKNGPGEINVPVVIGGKVVRPGDIVVGDADGIVIIDPSEAVQIQEKVLAVQKKEALVLKNILEKGIFERSWVDGKLRELNYKF